MASHLFCCKRRQISQLFFLSGIILVLGNISKTTMLPDKALAAWPVPNQQSTLASHSLQPGHGVLLPQPS